VGAEFYKIYINNLNRLTHLIPAGVKANEPAFGQRTIIIIIIIIIIINNLNHKLCLM